MSKIVLMQQHLLNIQIMTYCFRLIQSQSKKALQKTPAKKKPPWCTERKVTPVEISGCLGGLLWCWRGVESRSASEEFCPAVWTENNANGGEAQSGSSMFEDLPHAACGCLGGLSKCWGSQTEKSRHFLRKWKQRQCRKEELADHTWRSSSGTRIS